MEAQSFLVEEITDTNFFESDGDSMTLKWFTLQLAGVERPCRLRQGPSVPDPVAGQPIHGTIVEGKITWMLKRVLTDQERAAESRNQERRKKNQVMPRDDFTQPKPGVNSPFRPSIVGGVLIPALVAIEATPKRSVPTKREAQPSDRTHCKNGHEYTPETIFVDRKGYRGCKVCRYEHQKKSRTRHKAKA